MTPPTTHCKQDGGKKHLKKKTGVANALRDTVEKDRENG